MIDQLALTELPAHLADDDGAVASSARRRVVGRPVLWRARNVAGAVIGQPCGPAARMACPGPPTALCRQAVGRGPLIRLPDAATGVRRPRAAAQAAHGALRGRWCSRFLRAPFLAPRCRARAAEGFADHLVVHCGDCSLSHCSNDGCRGRGLDEFLIPPPRNPPGQLYGLARQAAVMGLSASPRPCCTNHGVVGLAFEFETRRGRSGP
jgi:hypothetical protein